MSREELDQERAASKARRLARFAPVIRRVLEREARERAVAEKAGRGGWPHTKRTKR